MRCSPILLVSALAAACLAPAAAEAQAPSRGVRGVVHQQLVALLNPMGAEHELRAGLRAPLGDPDELLFMGAHAEAGAVSYLSPVYAIEGGYLEVSPLAFLVLRAELTGAAVWPIGMAGAGHYGLSGYDADVSPQTLTAERGGSAGGWSLSLGATLQGLVPMGPVRLLIWDQLEAQHVSLGSEPYYYSMKHDLVLAQRDWVVQNDALLLLEADLSPNIALRVGAYDNLRHVPASGYLGHQLGPIAMLAIDHPSAEVSEVMPFVRAGYYTDHVQRADELTVLGGVSVTYDLGAVR